MLASHLTPLVLCKPEPTPVDSTLQGSRMLGKEINAEGKLDCNWLVSAGRIS